jgi:hypothetical protein
MRIYEESRWEDMRVRDLVRAIDLAFEEVGQKDDWLHRSFHSLYELGQLAHFQIFEINWFRGAQDIVDLVDQLHSAVTSKEDFVAMAELLGMDLPNRISKKELAKMVKAHKSWKLKAYELENRKKLERRKAALQPLFLHLASLGYHTEALPRQVSFGRWMVDCTNLIGAAETIYLNENESGDSVFIQSDKHDFIDIFKMEKNLFVKSH